MHKCKYNVVEYALALIIVPDILILSAAIVLLIIAAVLNQIDFSLVPNIVYFIIGGGMVLTHISYLILYLRSKKICQYNADYICFSDGKGKKCVSRSNIKEITYKKIALPLCWMGYDVYGSTTIYCNENLSCDIIHVKFFPHTIKRLRKLGYSVRYTK